MGGAPAGILYPLVTMAFDNSQAGVNNVTQPVLLIGQTITAQPAAIAAVFSVSQARSLFGRGSHLARMFEQYFANDNIGPINCLPLGDATGSTKAGGAFTLTGPATAAGTLAAYIGGQSVPVGVASGDTATTIATNLAAAITALPDLAVTAVAASGVVTVTAKNGGTLGNGIDLRLNYYGLANSEQLPAGVSCAINSMTGGATDPVLTAVAGLVGDQSFDFIVHPYSSAAGMAALAAMMSFSGGRWDPTRQSYGHAFTARSDTAANLAIYGATNDDPHSTVFAYETGSPIPVWEAAAIFCGAMAPSIRNLPNQPVQTLPLVGFLPPNGSGTGETAWGKSTWQTLLGKGLGLASYPVGGGAQILRAPTTYQVNAYGQPDQSYFDTEDMFLLMAISRFLAGRWQQKFGRSLVADDGTAFGAGLPIVTPGVLRSDMIAAYQQMQSVGWVEDVQAFIAASSVQRSVLYPSTMNVLFAPFLVVGLRDISITNQFRKFSAAAAAAFTA